MTINAPAALLLLLYELVAEQQGVSGEALRGTAQNDILKEYIARGNYIFPPKPSMRLTTDLFAYCAERMPSWNTISISGYHIREAGSTAVQELAFTLANGIAYCDAAVAAGLSPDDFGARLSFFFNAHNDFFQEVAKFRAARRLWARIMSERFGATNTKALALRFHAQTGGSTLTAQQPQNNIVRVAIQALSAVCGGAQSLHTNSFDEALALPSEHAARIALRTQQILASEAGGTNTADPLGGSFFIESLTDELEQRAWELIERVDELGGAVAAVEQGFVQDEIEQAAFRYQQEVEAGERVIVGVNRFHEDEGEPIELHRLDPEAEQPPARADGASARRAKRRRRGGSARCAYATPPAERRTCSRRCARRFARAARSARSATCCAKSGGCTTSSARPRERRARLSPRDERLRRRYGRGRGAHDRDEAGGLQGLRRRGARAARDVDRGRAPRDGAGVVRSQDNRDYGGGTIHWRAYSSAGALFPVEAYVAASHGLYSFDAAHARARSRTAATFARRAAAVDAAREIVVLTGIHARTGWKYMERGYRHVWWDAGTMLANLLALAAAEGLAPRLYTAFVDADVNEALGLDGEHEYALALLALGVSAVTFPLAFERAHELGARRRRSGRRVADASARRRADARP